MTVASLLAAVGLALAHLFSGRLRFLDATPRSRWLSAAGGISVAYVFVHTLPDLAEEQETLREAAGETLAFVESHAYLVALLGLAVFYGLERAAKTSRGRSRRTSREDSTGAGVFWLHVGSFAAYNALIGYLLLHRESSEAGSLLLYFVAMALHFVVNDHGLRENHKGAYDRIGRWMLAVAVLLGWGIGVIVEVSEAFLAVLFAFLAGGVIMNVLKEELPEERESSFWAFATGAALYAAVLLVTF